MKPFVKTRLKYKMVIAYDGTGYGGWQIQPNTTSIQSVIEQALSTTLRSPTPIIGSGRTDAGVHAMGQVAHFTAAPLETDRLCKSLSGLLPPTIRILHIEEVDETFHARYSAVSKEYHYHLHLSQTLDPFKRLYTYHPYFPLDIAKLQAAAPLFIGRHDFTSFVNKSCTNGVRTLLRLDVRLEEGGVRLEFEGDGFLYKMVRNITGTLLSIASGKLSLQEASQIVAAQERRRAPATAPAHGLFLMKVRYEKDHRISSKEAK